MQQKIEQPETFISDAKFSTSLVRRVFNNNLHFPIVQSMTWLKNAEHLRELIEASKVPVRFLDTNVSNKGAKYFDWSFICALYVMVKIKDIRKKTGERGKNVTVHEITNQDLERHLDEKALFLDFVNACQERDTEGNLVYKGKDFQFYFGLEGISCNNKSFYRWSELNPDLPAYVYGKKYTSEEFDQWRQFLLTKPGRKAPRQRAS